MIIRFTKVERQAQVKDRILNKKVPNFVYLQNQRLTKEMMKQKLSDDKMIRQELIRRAQVNEYIFTTLRENSGVE